MMSGNEADLGAVTGAAPVVGVEHGEALIAFADAVVSGDETSRKETRAALLGCAGAENVVDAAAVASNFERMVRIADATGIPLDAPLEAASVEMRADLGLDRFAAGHAD